MKRTLMPLELSTMKERIRGGERSLENFEKDLTRMCAYTVALEKTARKKNFEKAKKIVYLDKQEYDEVGHKLYLCLKSARYAKCREVINTETLASRGVLKKEKDGDEEKTHIIIKFDAEENSAVCVFEKNMDGIGIGHLFEYLNDRIIKYHDFQKDKVYYRITHANIVAKEFLEALENVRRIKAVTLTIAQEDLSVSETKAFAGKDDLSQDVDLYFRPSAPGKSITGDTVKEFYNLYNKSNRKVKRITVKADDQSQSQIVFDTEKIKEKEVVEVEETITGEVRESSIKAIMLKIVDKY